MEDTEIIFMYVFAQSDSPRCDHGWIAYNRSCYRIFGNRISWSAAARACRDTGGHLVRIDNDDEQRFLASIVRPKTWVCTVVLLSFILVQRLVNFGVCRTLNLITSKTV